MSWYYVNFDPTWVTCVNFECRAKYPKWTILRNRKCPRCKMDNQHCIKKRKVAKK